MSSQFGHLSFDFAGHATTLLTLLEPSSAKKLSRRFSVWTKTTLLSCKRGTISLPREKKTGYRLVWLAGVRRLSGVLSRSKPVALSAGVEGGYGRSVLTYFPSASNRRRCHGHRPELPWLPMDDMILTTRLPLS